MANTNWQKALEEFTNKIKKRFESRIVSVVLYGSRARGDAEPTSDIDLLLVIDDSAQIQKIQPEVDKIASEISLDYNTVISLIFFYKSRFEERSEPLLINIRKEGLKVA